LFTNYLNGETSPVLATGESTLQSDGTQSSWLSAGLTALKSNVLFKAFSPINLIRSITIGNMGLVFTPDTAWDPVADSNSVQASMGKMLLTGC
jgi:hypothetical protein